MSNLEAINLAADTLNNAINAYCQQHPLAPKRNVIEHILPKLLGTAPEWALKQHPPSGWTVSLGDVWNVGVFCVYYYKDPETGEILTLLQRRKEPLTSNDYKIGAVGGYADPGEKLYAAVARETREEICDATGEPIFEPKFYKYSSLFNDSDMRKNPPILYQAFCYELSKDEFEKLTAHAEKLNKDPDYKKAVFAATHNEITSLEIRPLREVAPTHMRSLFTYERQQDAYKATLQLLERPHAIPTCFQQDPGMAPYR